MGLGPLDVSLAPFRQKFETFRKSAIPPIMHGSLDLNIAWRQLKMDAFLVWLGTIKSPAHAEEFRRCVQQPLVQLRRWYHRAEAFRRRLPPMTAAMKADYAVALKHRHGPDRHWWSEIEAASQSSSGFDALRESFDEIVESLDAAILHMSVLGGTLRSEWASRQREIDAHQPGLIANGPRGAPAKQAVRGVATEFMPRRMLETWRWLASRWSRQRAPTQDDVAAALKMSPRTVRKYLHKLAGLGHVELDQRSRITRVAALPTGNVD